MKRPGPAPIAEEVSAALDNRDARGFELLLVHCAALSAAVEPRRPVFDRLRELLGVDLTRLLLVGLSGSQRTRARPPL
jgi:hypothetical protein